MNEPRSSHPAAGLTSDPSGVRKFRKKADGEPNPMNLPNYPFASHYLPINGARLHYLIEGPEAGETVVMVHGNPTWSFFFRKLVLALRDTYRVIVPDHIGMGLSDKPPADIY